MISALSHTPTWKTVATPDSAAVTETSGAPSDCASAAPAESLTLSSSRSLWQECSRLGLLAATPALSAPLGQVLSQSAKDELRDLLAQLSPERITFYSNWMHGQNPRSLADAVLEKPAGHLDLNLSVYGQGIYQCGTVLVNTLSDIWALDALYVRQQPEELERPALARALQNLSDQQFSFTRRYTSSQRCDYLGVYGAYRELIGRHNSDADMFPISVFTSKLLYFHPLIVKSETDVLAVNYFVAGGSLDGVPHPQRAQRLKQLADGGVTFHDAEGRVLHAYEAWQKESVQIGLATHPLETVDTDTLAVSNQTQELLELYRTTLHADVLVHQPHRTQAAKLVEACRTPKHGLSVKEQWHMLVDLQKLENHSVEKAIQDLDAAARGKRPHESLADAVAELKQLLKRMDQQVARFTFEYCREHFSDEAQRAHFVDVAATLGHFEAARAAAPMLWQEGVAGRVLEPIVQSTDAARTCHVLGMLQHRPADLTLPRALDLFLTLHTRLTPAKGWDATRQLFQYLTESWAAQRFPHRTYEASVQHAMHLYLLTGGLEEVRRTLTEAGEVQADDHSVDIGGVVVRRRLTPERD